MGADERTDVEVLAAAAAGDARAFAVLWDRHRYRVFGHALRLTRVRADAEDATAIVFLEAWRKQSRIRDVDASILRWLLVTTTNVCRNPQRAGRRYRSALDSLPHVTDPREPTATDLDLQNALQTLPMVDQQLLGLTLEGYSTTEAAQAVGISPGAALAQPGPALPEHANACALISAARHLLPVLHSRRITMTPLDFDPAFSAGVRTLLIATASPVRARRRRRIGIGACLVAGLTVLGAGGAVAANLVLPGADNVTDTSDSHTVTGTGPTVIDIGHAPTGTNSLETSLACLSAGTLTWPDGASQTCTSADPDRPGSFNLAWTPDRTTFNLGATEGTPWRLTYTFSHHQPTALATHAAGQTYGIDSNNRHPDLIAATATNGRDG